MENTIVISAINFSSGGPLSILKDSLAELSKSYSDRYKIIALVHDAAQFSIENIEYRSYPLSKKSWIIRMCYEYVFFYFLSLKLKPAYWFSMHDMTPNVKCRNRIVYCHNPSPFYVPKKNDWYKNLKVYLFSKFYKYLYGINIRKNSYVIVQQSWLRSYFEEIWQLNNVVVAYPEVKTEFDATAVTLKNASPNKEGIMKRFFYPSFPRPFKNFEIACEAYSRLPDTYKQKAKLYLTLSGDLNTYAQELVEKYGQIEGIQFVGLLTRQEVFEQYEKADCLIFPSKLETWGLPISEFKNTGKPILLCNKPYAKETLGDYEKVSFFEEDCAEELKDLMQTLIDENIVFDGNTKVQVNPPFTKGWPSLFNLILNEP